MEDRRRTGRQHQEPTMVIARENGAHESDIDELEFSFRGREPPIAGGAAADELFYPVFGRVFEDARPERRPLGRLFSEETRNSSVGSTSSSSSSAATDLDGASLDSYCLWTPGASAASSPARSPRKSGSTGSLSGWRRVSELVLGRSHSDGRDEFGRFLSAPPSPAREQQTKGKPKGGRKGTEVHTVAASHHMFYGAKASPGAARRTFLPYRQDLLVGLFSAPKGLSRSHYTPSF